MALSLRLGVLALLFVGTNAGESPVAKVTKLLEDLKKEVESDAKKEAAAYDDFACFCKDTTKAKSKSITECEDKISTLSADIADNTATKETKQSQVQERKANHEELGKDLAATVARCSTAQSHYEADAADMSKAIESLNKAIKAMSAKKGKMGAASFASLDKEVQDALLIAKIDPSDPAYKYHSKEINEILAKLLKDFTDSKKDGADKWAETSQACTATKTGLNTKMTGNLKAIQTAEENIADLKKKIAKDRGDLVNSQTDLQDDSAYLKDLTSQCETKARAFDQRASMRNDEISALSQAVAIISNKVKDADADVNVRAFVQNAPKVVLAKVVAKVVTAKKVSAPAAKKVSLLQAVPVKAVTNFLASKASTTEEAIMNQKVVSLLRSEGSRLNSPEISMLAMGITEDHFEKVKEMIQSLIERLLDEVKAEASKKGFCDTEIAKATKDRDYARQHASSMSAELKELEASKEKLESELTQLGKDITEANSEAAKAADLRKKDKKQNTESLQTAQDGLQALKEAILILKSFYSGASRARVLLQASPVDADAPVVATGAYQGKEKSSRSIFALLETISADFERTISQTEQAEADAAAAFVEFDRTSRETIGSKETKTKLNEQDLKSTKSNIATTLDDLKSEMGLLDDALKMVDSLKPTCLDAGGMNSKERTTKRNEEVAALNKALCILTPGKKEGECD